MKTPESEWPVSWEANERARLRDNLKLTFRQRMQWVENTLAFAKILQNAPTRTLQDMKAAYAKSNKAKDSSTS
jgi:hypothetical protein